MDDGSDSGLDDSSYGKLEGKLLKCKSDTSKGLHCIGNFWSGLVWAG